MTFNCFHGTDSKNIDGILNSEFIAKKNRAHWLGNGAYFYLDYSLAAWWTSNPTNKFGTKIIEPAVIKCAVDVDVDEVLDLRWLDDYNKFVDIYRHEFLPYYAKKTDFAERIDNERLRCSFCDYVNRNYKVKAIIGTFNAVNQPYLPRYASFGFSEFNLPFIETQVCVFDQDIIKDKHLCEENLRRISL